MRFGGTPFTLSGLASIGQISETELNAVNGKLDELNRRVTQQYAIIYEARRVGFGRDIVDEAMRAYDRILVQLQALASTPPGGGAAFGEWLARAEGVDAQIGELEQHVSSTFPGGSRARMFKIIGVSALVLAGVGALSFVVWYVGRSNRWYRHVYGRRRSRRRGRR
jgi:hypothetical protein